MTPDRTSATAAVVTTLILQEELDRALACEAMLDPDGDPDAIHAYRVAQRRTRVVLLEYGEVLAPDAPVLRNDLRWLARRTGPVRDLDLLLERVRPAGLAATVRGMRREAFELLSERLRTDRHAALVQRWTALGDGAVVVGAAERVAFATLTRRRLAECFDRLIERMAAVTAEPSDDLVHRVRIAAKAVRYLLEFLQRHSPSADGAASIVALKRLQDRLGAFQDLVVHVGLLRSIDRVDAARLADGLGRRRDRMRPAVLRAIARMTGPRMAARMNRLTRPRAVHIQN